MSEYVYDKNTDIVSELEGNMVAIIAAMYGNKPAWTFIT